jgi:hypothetical protein
VPSWAARGRRRARRPPRGRRPRGGRPPRGGSRSPRLAEALRPPTRRRAQARRRARFALQRRSRGRRRRRSGWREELGHDVSGSAAGSRRGQTGAQQPDAAVDVVADAARRDHPLVGVHRRHPADREAVAPVDVGHGDRGADDPRQVGDVGHLLEAGVAADVVHHPPRWRRRCRQTRMPPAEVPRRDLELQLLGRLDLLRVGHRVGEGDQGLGEERLAGRRPELDRDVRRVAGELVGHGG